MTDHENPPLPLDLAQMMENARKRMAEEIQNGQLSGSFFSSRFARGGYAKSTNAYFNPFNVEGVEFNIPDFTQRVNLRPRPRPNEWAKLCTTRDEMLALGKGSKFRQRLIQIAFQRSKTGDIVSGKDCISRARQHKGNEPCT